MEPAWSEEKLYFSGDEYFVDVMQAIASARHSVDIETYIFKDDALGIQLEAALSNALRRGVRVRALVDAFGSMHLHDRGGYFRFYNPLRFWWRLNHRDHRKLIIVDGETAWIGSFNICAEHLSTARGGGGWHDMGVRVRGGPLDLVIASFEQTWQGRRRSLPPSHWVRLNLTQRMRYRSNRQLRYHIATAQKELWITSAYFIPRTLLLRGLAAAARRGVDVRVLIPRKSDVFFAPWVMSLYTAYLVASGVKVYEYLPSILHAKALLIDDWYAIGSSNFNHRSVIHDLEIDVVLGSTESKAQLRQQFLADCAQSRENHNEAPPRGWRGFVARLLWFLRRYG